jgi:uncharacterized phage-associated protein
MLSQAQPCDLHKALKACYFADKEHLNKYDRPIFGATYRAMKFGPVPLEIYEMAQGNPYYLAELRAERYPWTLRGYHLELTGNEPLDMATLSKSDIECLKNGFKRSAKMSFSERTAATHGRDWQRANLGTMMYEDMLDDTPHKEAKLAELRETARFIRL